MNIIQLRFKQSGAKTSITSYHPLAYTLKIGKLLENHLKPKLSSHKDRLLHSSTHGLLPKIGTQTNILNFYDELANLLSTNNGVNLFLPIPSPLWNRMFISSQLRLALTPFSHLRFPLGSLLSPIRGFPSRFLLIRSLVSYSGALQMHQSLISTNQYSFHYLIAEEPLILRTFTFKGPTSIYSSTS